MKRAWITIGGSALGEFAVPVHVVKCGPKRALVRLLVRAKLPSASGGIWRPKGHQTWVPEECVGGKPIDGDLVLDGRGRIRVTAPVGKGAA